MIEYTDDNDPIPAFDNFITDTTEPKKAPIKVVKKNLFDKDWQEIKNGMIAEKKE